GYIHKADGAVKPKDNSGSNDPSWHSMARIVAPSPWRPAINSSRAVLSPPTRNATAPRPCRGAVALSFSQKNPDSVVNLSAARANIQGREPVMTNDAQELELARRASHGDARCLQD